MKIQIALVLLILAIKVYCLPAEDEVKSLKGYYDFSQQFKMYSGYLKIQQTPLLSVHYVFITSKNKPETDDLVLWSNGGPGCSSLLGFLNQLGPHILFQGSDKLSPSKNPYSWNNNANVLFLQSPPGVGFSINKDQNYVFNDPRTAADTYSAIKVWFSKFPEFTKNKFWISGESYCGMYTPLLAQQLLNNINTIIPGQKLNFQGMLIGNGVMLTEGYWRRQARNTFYSRHYFYGPEIKSLLTSCKYNSSDATNPSCLMGNKLADEAVKRINPYNSIGICYADPQSSNGKPRRRFWYTAFDEEMYNLVEDEPGCSTDNTGIIKYFNDKTVQQQLHVPDTVWSSCSDLVGNTFKKDLTTIPLFPKFKQAGLKILLYSGNVDAQVSYVETEEYIRQIGWKQTVPRQPVQNPRGSLEGWVTKYDGLVYYVVNGAGHMVPAQKPGAALRMLQNFIAGKL